jgi:predicted helicase
MPVTRPQIPIDVSSINSNPNGYNDDERYSVALVERVVRVSVETVNIVRGLPFRMGD